MHGQRRRWGQARRAGQAAGQQTEGHGHPDRLLRRGRRVAESARSRSAGTAERRPVRLALGQRRLPRLGDYRSGWTAGPAPHQKRLARIGQRRRRDGRLAQAAEAIAGAASLSDNARNSIYSSRLFRISGHRIRPRSDRAPLRAKRKARSASRSRVAPAPRPSRQPRPLRRASRRRHARPARGCRCGVC